MHHVLKIFPEYYCRVCDGTKTFEIRKNDRGYQKGDTVELREWDPEIVTKYDDTPIGGSYKVARGYTGSPVLRFVIGYVLPIDATNVVFSLLQEKE